MPDSARFRVRLSQYYWDFLHENYAKTIRSAIPREIGATVPYIANVGFSVAAFFEQAVTADVLSAITLVHRNLLTVDYRIGAAANTQASNAWLAFVRRVFQEENLAYTLDAECGVHPLADVQFERNIATTIAGLGEARYAAVRTAIEAMEAKFGQMPPDTKGAIRDAFEAAETLTKVITNSGKALDYNFVMNEILSRIHKIYDSDSTAHRCGGEAAKSFANWVNAAHCYRHGQKTEEPIAPPGELAILLVSQAASYIRWLVDLDRQLSS